MTVEIAPAGLDALRAIAASMRPVDWREIDAVAPDGTTPETVARWAFGSVAVWALTWRGEPVAAFGVQPIAATVLQAWAFGTRRMWRAVPALTGFIVGECVPRWTAAGVTRVEARSIADHHAAHRWMLGMGGEPQPCPGYGRRGEDFILFAWTARR